MLVGVEPRERGHKGAPGSKLAIELDVVLVGDLKAAQIAHGRGGQVGGLAARRSVDKVVEHLNRLVPKREHVGRMVEVVQVAVKAHGLEGEGEAFAQGGGELHPALFEITVELLPEMRIVCPVAHRVDGAAQVHVAHVFVLAAVIAARVDAVLQVLDERIG